MLCGKGFVSVFGCLYDAGYDGWFECDRRGGVGQ
jgi:hypothetical protein